MWKISKEFDFCYGHRVWNQTLNSSYSLDNKCVCRHLHGHQGKVIVELTAYSLNHGMVTDFKHLNWFKKFLDDNLDHKFIIDAKDPMFYSIIPHTFEGKELKLSWLKHEEGHSIINPNFFKTIAEDSLIDILEGFVVVEFVPTSENLSQWLYKIVSERMLKIGVETTSVKFYETPKSSSHYVA